MNRKLAAKLRAFAIDLERELSTLEAEERARYVELRDAALAVASGRALPSSLRPAEARPDVPNRPRGLRLVQGSRSRPVGSWRPSWASDHVGAVPRSAADVESARLEREARVWLKAREG